MLPNREGSEELNTERKAIQELIAGRAIKDSHPSVDAGVTGSKLL
jgi:hypothetical protein